VERDGDQALYLNDLRVQGRLRSQPEVAAHPEEHAGCHGGAGARGSFTVWTTAVPRSSPRCRASRSLRGSSWPRSTPLRLSLGEAADVAYRGRVRVASGGFLGGTGLYWERGLKRRYQRPTPRGLPYCSARRYEHLIQQANHVIFVSDKGGHIVEARTRG